MSCKRAWFKLWFLSMVQLLIKEKTFVFYTLHLNPIKRSFSLAAGHPKFDTHRQYSRNSVKPAAAVTAISMDYGSLQSMAVSPRSTIEATRPTASWKIPRTSETISPRRSWVSLFLGNGWRHCLLNTLPMRQFSRNLSSLEKSRAWLWKS